MKKLARARIGMFTVHRTQMAPQPKPALVEKRIFTQAEQRANTSAVQSALSHALQHVPMTNGANTGGSTQVCPTLRLVYDITYCDAGRFSKY